MVWALCEDGSIHNSKTAEFLAIYKVLMRSGLKRVRGRPFFCNENCVMVTDAMGEHDRFTNSTYVVANAGEEESKVNELSKSFIDEQIRFQTGRLDILTFSVGIAGDVSADTHFRSRRDGRSVIRKNRLQKGWIPSPICVTNLVCD